MDRYDERDFAIIQNTHHLDDGESLFFARELEHIKTRTYDVLFPELSAMSVIPVSTEVSPGAENITYYTYEAVGMAKIISNYADDLPRVDLVGKPNIARIKSIGESYGYSLQDIRAAKFAGKPLEQRKANAARRANDQEVNRIAWYGNKAHGLTGLLNNPNIPEYILPADGASGSVKFKDKSSDQIIRDLNGMANSIVSLTKGVEIPDTMLCSHDIYSELASRRIEGTDKTVMTFFLEQSPYIKTVRPCPELQGIGDQEEDGIIIYKKDPDKLTLEIPQAFEQLPVQPKNLEFVVPCHSRCGGVIIYYPLSLAIAYM